VELESLHGSLLVTTSYDDTKQDSSRLELATQSGTDLLQVGPFNFSVGSQFLVTKTQSELKAAASVYDLIPPAAY
jgi:hypothetical protein